MKISPSTRHEAHKWCLEIVPRFHYITQKHVLSHDCIITGAVPDEQERSKCTSHEVESPRDPPGWSASPMVGGSNQSQSILDDRNRRCLRSHMLIVDRVTITLENNNIRKKYNVIKNLTKTLPVE